MDQAPLVIAHRGNSICNPENTLSAFRSAFEVGSRAIEADFRICGDGRIVCVHDLDTRRVGNVSLEIASNGYDRLSGVDVGSWKSPEFEGERIPLLEAVLELLTPETQLFAELKDGPEMVSAFVNTVIDRLGSFEQVSVISFNADSLMAVRRLRPDARIYWISDVEANAKGGLAPSAGSVLEELSRIGAYGYSSSATLSIDQDYVSAILDGGYEYNMWTIDDPAVASRFAEMGVGSVSTNDPNLILDSLGQT